MFCSQVDYKTTAFEPSDGGSKAVSLMLRATWVSRDWYP